MITIAEEADGHVEREPATGFHHGAHGHRGARQIGLPDRRITEDGVDWPGHILIGIVGTRLDPAGGQPGTVRGSLPAAGILAVGGALFMHRSVSNDRSGTAPDQRAVAPAVRSAEDDRRKRRGHT